jgi:hypothetical protein
LLALGSIHQFQISAILFFNCTFPLKTLLEDKAEIAELGKY